MEYDQVADTAEAEPLVEHRLAEANRIRIQRRALYACFAVFIAVKMLVVCWVLTQSFPLDAISRVLRGEWLWESNDDRRRLF